jgi:hypothetical protein
MDGWRERASERESEGARERERERAERGEKPGRAGGVGLTRNPIK